MGTKMWEFSRSEKCGYQGLKIYINAINMCLNRRRSLLKQFVSEEINTKQKILAFKKKILFWEKTRRICSYMCLILKRILQSIFSYKINYIGNNFFYRNVNSYEFNQMLEIKLFSIFKVQLRLQCITSL